MRFIPRNQKYEKLCEPHKILPQEINDFSSIEQPYEKNLKIFMKNPSSDVKASFNL